MHTSPALFSRKFIPPFSVLLIGLIALLVKCWDLLLQRSETAPCNVYSPAVAEIICFRNTWRGAQPLGSGAAGAAPWGGLGAPLASRTQKEAGVNTCWNHKAYYFVVICIYSPLYCDGCASMRWASTPKHPRGVASYEHCPELLPSPPAPAGHCDLWGGAGGDLGAPSSVCPAVGCVGGWVGSLWWREGAGVVCCHVCGRHLQLGLGDSEFVIYAKI